MAAPHNPENNEDFTHYHDTDFGFIDSTSYEQVLSMPQTSFYSNSYSSFETSQSRSFHAVGQTKEFQSNSLGQTYLQDPSAPQIDTEVSNWHEPLRFTSTRAVTEHPLSLATNISSLQFTPLDARGFSQSGDYDKQPVASGELQPWRRVLASPQRSPADMADRIARHGVQQRSSVLPQMRRDSSNFFTSQAVPAANLNLKLSDHDHGGHGMVINHEVVLSPASNMNWGGPEFKMSLTSDATTVSSSQSRTSRRVAQFQGFSQCRQSGAEAASAAPLPSGRGFMQPGSIQQRDPQTLQFANERERGMLLLNTLISCGDAVANGNENQRAKSLVNELSKMVDPLGDSMQRVASYFTYGLVGHIVNMGSGPSLYRALQLKVPGPADTLDAFHVFSKICPFITFGEAAATQSMLEAFQGEQDVHCIDLGMVQHKSLWSLPYQLLQGLASRNGGPPKIIRMTGVQVKSANQLGSAEGVNGNIYYDQSGRLLKEFADRLNLNFTFTPVLVEKLEHLEQWMLSDARSGQAVAINCSAKLHTLLHDEGKSLNRILKILHEIRPKLFCVLEQEANHNGTTFLARFLEALHFYSAIFDSLEVTHPRNSTERCKVEQLWLGQEIINIIACKNQDRVVRHEMSHQWRSRLSKAGFRQMSLSERTLAQIRSVRSISHSTGFTLAQDGGFLTLNFRERSLYSFSTWTVLSN